MSFLDVFQAGAKRTNATARIDGIAPYPFVVHHAEADEFISRQIADSGTWEPLETLLIQRLAPHFGVFLDLGANIGWYTALAQRLMPQGSEIHAFEPDSRNFRLLKINAANAGHAGTHLSRMAVADKPGFADLAQSRTNLGDHRLGAPAKGQRTARVPVTTLDAYFGDRALPPLLAKIDTQGSEPRILAGAQRTLSAQARENVMILEFWPSAMEENGQNVDAFIEHLSGLAERPFRINHQAGALQPMTWERLARRADDLRTMRLFFDLLVAAPEAKAMASIADLISSVPEGEGDAPLHI